MDWKALPYGDPPPALAGHAAVGWPCELARYPQTLPFLARVIDGEETPVMLVVGVPASKLPESSSSSGDKPAATLTMTDRRVVDEALAPSAMQLWALHYSSGQWIRPLASGTPPAPSFAHSATLLQGLGVVVYGGVEPTAASVLSSWSLLKFTEPQWSWSALRLVPTAGSLLPSGRYGHTVSVIRTKTSSGVEAPAMLLFGGQGLRSDSCMADLYIITVDAAAGLLHCRQIKETGSLWPSARSYHSSSVVSSGRYVVVIGGRGRDGKVMQDVNIFDTYHEQWVEPGTPQGALPPARCKHSASVIEERFVCLVGGATTGSALLTDLSVLDLKTMTWALYSNVGEEHLRPGPRCRHTSCSLADKIVLYGGMGLNGWTNMLHYLCMHTDDEKQLLSKQVQEMATENSKLRDLVESLTEQLLAHQLQPREPERLKKYSAVRKIGKKRHRVSFNQVETLHVERAQGLDVVPGDGAAPLGLGTRVVKRTVDKISENKLAVPEMAEASQEQESDLMADISPARARKRLERIPESTRVKLLKLQGIKDRDLEKEAHDLNKIRHERAESLCFTFSQRQPEVQ